MSTKISSVANISTSKITIFHSVPIFNVPFLHFHWIPKAQGKCNAQWFFLNFNCTLTVNICNVYRISSYKALPRIIPPILIIPAILIIVCSENVVFSNKEGYVRKYGIHLMLIYSTFSPYFRIFALSELYIC